jgi:hypothetical protein
MKSDIKGYMKIRKVWKNSMLLVVGLTVLMMMAASVTAEDGETEAPVPDDTHDASNGERVVEDTLTDEHNPDSPYWDTDGNVIIAPNPGDMEDITMTDDSAADDDDTVMTAGLPVFGALAAIGALAIALIIRHRKIKKV